VIGPHEIQHSALGHPDDPVVGPDVFSDQRARPGGESLTLHARFGLARHLVNSKQL
jgi:hypothetical protein